MAIVAVGQGEYWAFAKPFDVELVDSLDVEHFDEIDDKEIATSLGCELGTDIKKIIPAARVRLRAGAVINGSTVNEGPLSGDINLVLIQY